MSALDGIKARQELREAAGTPWESLPELTDEQVIMHRVYDDERHCIAECSSPQVAELIANAPTDLARLVTAVEAVEKLAANWQARGEHDMAYSKTIQDEDIAMHLLTEGASMVENARHIRNALAEGRRVLPAR